MNKTDKIILRIDDDIKDKVKELRAKHSINISNYLRQCILDKYNQVMGDCNDSL